MTKQQFRKGRLYHFRGRRWDQRTGTTQNYETIVIGELVRSHVDPIARTRDCLGEFQPDERTYRIDDGHLPDCQPRVSGRELPGLMGPHKIRFAYPAPTVVQQTFTHAINAMQQPERDRTLSNWKSSEDLYLGDKA